MSNKFNKNAGANKKILKYMEELGGVERKAAHRRLKAKAVCTHTTDHLTPALEPRKKGDRVLWYCKFCGEEVNLKRLTDDELNDFVSKCNQICDMIKLMNNGSERERELIEKVIADVQLKVNAYLVPAYKMALNVSGKKNNRNRNGRRRSSSVTWGGQ